MTITAPASAGVPTLRQRRDTEHHVPMKSGNRTPRKTQELQALPRASGRLPQADVDALRKHAISQSARMKDLLRQQDDSQLASVPKERLG